jgi:hypothetical protein
VGILLTGSLSAFDLLLICLSDGFADFASQKLYDLIVSFVNLVFLAKKSCLFVCVPV